MTCTLWARVLFGAERGSGTPATPLRPSARRVLGSGRTAGPAETARCQESSGRSRLLSLGKPAGGRAAAAREFRDPGTRGAHVRGRLPRTGLLPLTVDLMRGGIVLVEAFGHVEESHIRATFHLELGGQQRGAERGQGAEKRGHAEPCHGAGRGDAFPPCGGRDGKWRHGEELEEEERKMRKRVKSRAGPRAAEQATVPGARRAGVEEEEEEEGVEALRGPREPRREPGDLGALREQ